MGLFSKKKEVVDLRPKDADMPIPAKMRERLLAGNVSASSSSANVIPAISSSAETTSSGGIFGFFGADNSANNSATNSAAASTETSSASTGATSTPATDFWGNPVNNNSTASNSIETETSSHKLSKISDRLELIEMKLDRLERKTGIKPE